MSKLASMITEYVESPKVLRDALHGLTHEQLIARPIPGKWSTLEVVCHLADYEPILVDRMKKILAFDKPVLWAIDENEFVKALAYHERDVSEELALIESTRTAFARILRTKPDTVLTREGVHTVRGILTFERILQMANGHIQNHVKFVMEKRKALGV